MTAPPSTRIRALTDADDDVALGRELVREYAIATAEEMTPPGGSPARELEKIMPHFPDWHDFESRYLRGGAFLIATTGDGVAGCVGVTPVDRLACEMNRLWVRPAFRRKGVARCLVMSSLDEARRLGFRAMTLDALSTRTRAIALYRALGFEDAPSLHRYDFDVVSLGRCL